MTGSPKIFPLSESCITVDFGNEVSLDLNRRSISLAKYFQTHAFPGFIEAVPAYASLSIFYDLVEVRRSYAEFDTAFDAVSTLIKSALLTETREGVSESSTVTEIAVDFSDDAAPDLNFVAEFCGMTKDAVIERFISRSYRVYMLGFLPGFAYMGEVDEAISVPRKESPRLRVPKGSVGITSRQAGIYPLESPGGWQIIGRTRVEMFDADRDPVSMLSPGDEVRFVRER